MTTSVVDHHSFRDAAGQFATGLTIVSGIHNGQPVGMTVQSFMSLSLEPTLIALAVSHTSTTWPLIEPAGSFAVNVLSSHHRSLVRRFSTRAVDRFSSAPFRRSSSGNPVLDDAATWLDCRLHRTYDGGDHTIVIGEVVEIKPTTDQASTEALLYFRSQFHRTTTFPIQTSPTEEGIR